MMSLPKNCVRQGVIGGKLLPAVVMGRELFAALVEDGQTFECWLSQKVEQFGLVPGHDYEANDVAGYIFSAGAAAVIAMGEGGKNGVAIAKSLLGLGQSVSDYFPAPAGKSLSFTSLIIDTLAEKLRQCQNELVSIRSDLDSQSAMHFHSVLRLLRLRNARLIYHSKAPIADWQEEITQIFGRDMTDAIMGNIYDLSGLKIAENPRLFSELHGAWR